MNLFLAGLDHTTAPIDVREHLAFNESDLHAALRQLTGLEGGKALFREAAILSTCNRVEIYGTSGDNSTARKIVDFLAEFHGVPADKFVHTLFFYTGETVVRHLCATSSGLRSLVLGEAQIQGQVRTAHENGRNAGSLGAILDRLFRTAIVSGKRVRTETAVGSGAASVSQAGVEMARRRFGSLSGRTVLLVGSGEVSELAAQNLLANGADQLIVVNRTLENARKLAERYQARAYSLDYLQFALGEADIVISSTAAPVSIINEEHICRALQAKQQRAVGGGSMVETMPEMLLIDLAVPRDIDAAVSHLPGVHLATVDDLREVVNQTLEQRGAEIEKAQAIVDAEVEDFMAWLRFQDALPTLSTLRQQIDEMRCAELQRAMRFLSGLDPDQQKALDAFSRALVNKMLHTPTRRVRDAAATGDGQRYAAMLRELFGIEAI
jgi:glutamyl-tRNA reductase